MQTSENVLALGGRRHNSARQRLTRTTEVYKQGGGGNEQVCLMRLSCGYVQKHEEDFKDILRRVCSNKAAMGKHMIVPQDSYPSF